MRAGPRLRDGEERPVTAKELLGETRVGFENIDLEADIKESALSHLEEWLENRKFAGLMEAGKDDYFPLLAWLAAEGRFDLLLDSFHQVMPFGTGGRRGPVGIGPNRINPYTIASSVQGHVEYLRDLLPGEERFEVVVAYDVRRYNDLRGLYPRGLPNPLLGLTSKDFARIAASVYSAAGVRVYMLPDEPRDYVSTPELSFFIRLLGAHGGLNVSASHNHPDDNGGKFYNAQGGQEIPPNDERMVKIVEKISSVDSISYAGARASGWIRPITAAHRQAYVDLNLGLRLRSDAGPAKIVFTPLHGTGRNTVGRCLEEAGFQDGRQLFTVEQQREPRGDFARVPFRAPNPEVPESLESAMALAREKDADIVLGADPDADRIGAAVRRGGGMVFVNGNELAVILTRYRLESLERAGRLPRRPLVIKTLVTTELMARIASAFGAQVIGDLLVGFKYVGDILHHLERNGRFRGIEARPQDFVIAAEESHGLLLTPHIRDKDAAGAAVVLAELTSDLKEQGRTLYDYLVDTYKRYGYYRNGLRSTILQGAAGTAAIRTIQKELRTNPPGEIGGFPLVSVHDWWDEKTFGAFQSETDRSARDLISLTFEGGLRAVVRPSGTEPKNKVYVEKGAEPIGAEASEEDFLSMRQRIDREVAGFSNAFMKSMWALIGVSLPDYALAISDLAPLANKRRFVESFIPGFEERTRALQAGEMGAAALNGWIDEELGGYGPDARLLVARAVRSYLDSESAPASASIRALQRDIFFRSAQR